MNSTEIDIDKYLSVIYVVLLCRDVNTQSEAVFSNGSKVKLQ